MPVHITYFDARANADRGFLAARNIGGIVGAQLGAAEQIAVGAAAQGGTDDTARLALIKTTEDARINVVAGNASASATSGMWLAGETDVRFVPAGMRIGVIAP